MFKHLKDISKECDTDLRVIFTGVQEKNNFGTYPTLEFLDYARKIRFFEEEGITFIDLTSNPHLIDYRKNLKKYTIKNDGHPNEAGAELLFKAINQSGII